MDRLHRQRTPVRQDIFRDSVEIRVREWISSIQEGGKYPFRLCILLKFRRHGKSTHEKQHRRHSHKVEQRVRYFTMTFS